MADTIVYGVSAIILRLNKDREYYHNVSGQLKCVIDRFYALEDMGIFTNHDKGVMEKISEMVQRM